MRSNVTALSLTAGPVFTATLYGLVDGALAGAVFGWLYNSLSRQFSGGAT